MFLEHSVIIPNVSAPYGLETHYDIKMKHRRVPKQDNCRTDTAFIGQMQYTILNFWNTAYTKRKQSQIVNIENVILKRLKLMYITYSINDFIIWFRHFEESDILLFISTFCTWHWPYVIIRWLHFMLYFDIFFFLNIVKAISNSIHFAARI